jgi:two-component system NtrC family sensor kinase
MRLLRTVSFRVFAGSLALLLVAFGLYATFIVRLYTRQMMNQAIESAHRVSDLIESSTRYSMLLNRKEDVYQIIRTIGIEPGVEGIRIYNKRGEITFSTDPVERGKLVDLHAEACYACHAPARPLEALPSSNRTRIYRSRDGHRVLGVINPIRNSPQCAAGGCHATPAERTVLGVLDVRMSLARADDAIGEAQTRTLWIAAWAFLAVAISSAAFLHLTVRRPIRALTEGTRQIAAGNLDHAIDVRSSDDLGRLAGSFNAMTRSLRESLEENRRWARTLEDRVREKTGELESAHAQVLQSEKMASLGTLAATVAHEINNPLTGILTYAKLQAKRIRREGASTEAMQRLLADLELIIQETQRCGAIVNNLLLFSRRQVAEIHRVILREVIDRAVQLVAHHLAISKVTLERRCEPEDLAVIGDEAQLEQALVALFVNAVEAMPEGGTLRVEAAREGEGGGVTLRVSDTGLGVAPQDLPRIFEPFFTTKSGGKGVGLGLSVVYGIVERHGATIAAASTPGRGTTFTLRFPPAGPGTAAGASAPPPGARSEATGGGESS